MKVKDSAVTFELCDRPFVEKVGLVEATTMVLDYSAFNDTPFIYEPFQLSSLLGIEKGKMFDIIRNKKKHYRTITLKKKNGKTRKITAPDFDLSCMQHRILFTILNKLPVSEYATAYYKGSTLYNNAKPHTNRKYLLKLDITDFFGSIDFSEILSTVFNTSRYPKQIGYLLTEICTLDDALPQGAPSSPAISNLVMKHFDDTMGAWCKKNGISYTRYCDDMTFSSDKPLYHVYKKAESMLGDMGFSLNESKTRFLTSAHRQTVTGLVVNEKVSVPREYKRDLRQKIYYIRKYGFDERVYRMLEYDDSRKCFYRLMGKIGYILQIEPDNQFFRKAMEDLPKLAKYEGI